MLNLNLLNQVWEDIKNKTLPHSNKLYHDGELHCLAGWIVIKDAETRGYVLTPTENELLYCGDYSNILKFSPVLTEYHSCFWDTAQNLIGINSLESCVLFSSDATIEFQQCFIDFLNLGHRIDIVDENNIFYDKYNNQKVLRFKPGHTNHVLTSMLQEYNLPYIEFNPNYYQKNGFKTSSF